MSFPSSSVQPRRASAARPQGSEGQSLRDFAYFYEPFWRSGAASSIKTLLLFFDGIALTVPDYLRGAPFAPDRAFADQLDDLGLLVRLNPEALIDKKAATSLTQLLGDLFAAHSVDTIDQAVPYRALSRPQCGTSTDPAFTDPVLDALVQQGLARPSCGGAAVSLHPVVRECVLIALPQILRESAENAGYALQPMTTHPRQVRALLDLLSLEPLPTTGHLVAMDVEQVTYDLQSVPLDEVLAFRSEYGAAHRAYARGLREYLRGAATMPRPHRNPTLLERRGEIADLAEAIRKIARTAWQLPLARCALGIAGSAIPSASDNHPGQIHRFSSALLGVDRNSDARTVYSYLFEVQNQLTCHPIPG